MKTIFFSTSILLISTLINSCGMKKLTPENSEGKSKSAKKMSIIGELKDMPEKNRATKIISASISENFLNLEVQYGGGCQEHSFGLIGSQNISKSLPPIRSITLTHESPEDLCKAIISRKLKIDIRQFAYKQEAGSEIYLKLDGWDEKLKYTFVAEK